VLGDAFTGGAGREVGRLVAYLAPWMVTSVAYTVVFPLLFVVRRERVLVPLGAAAIAAHAAIAYGLREAFGMPGIAISLAVSTLLVVAVLLYELSPRMLVLTVVGLARVVAVVGAVAGAAFVGPTLVTGGFLAAGAGLALYALALAAIRPKPLRDAWAYLRVLH
jgi:hypothetical protein